MAELILSIKNEAKGTEVTEKKWTEIDRNRGFEPQSREGRKVF